MHLETREEEIARKLEEQRKALEAERCIAIVKQMEADRENAVRQMLRLGNEPDKIAEVTGMSLNDVLKIANRK